MSGQRGEKEMRMVRARRDVEERWLHRQCAWRQGRVRSKRICRGRKGNQYLCKAGVGLHPGRPEAVNTDLRKKNEI